MYNFTSLTIIKCRNDLPNFVVVWGADVVATGDVVITVDVVAGAVVVAVNVESIND